MTLGARMLFEQAAAFLRRQSPRGFVVTKDPAKMDDVTLFVVVALGLFAYYMSGDSDTAIDITVRDTGDAAQPAPQPPAPIPAPEPAPQPSPVPAPQPPTQGGDQIDVSRFRVVGGSPSDVLSWPITTQLTIAGIEPAIVPSFPDPGWPDTIPPGFADPIEYTVYAFVPALGVGAGFIEMWRGRENCGNNDAGNARLQLAQNWWYYVGEMAGYVPSPGESIGFMVAAGDHRMGKGPFPVRERSNVVLVTV